MSALAKNIGLSNDNTSVTKISAHARIDYILRFSKQAILVIDESDEQNAPISGQFLADLPEQHNAAYIALSPQFNNIQIRCRIIEQLYTGELFDPEISLAVSVINLAKKSPQAISIVLDNTQHLSIQILHELSQLAAIAKKANLIVNVVLFGATAAGKVVAENKSLFADKLTLLSAQSGQLLSPTSSLFKNTRAKWHFIIQAKWLLVTFAILLGLGVIVMVLLQQDSFNFAKAIASSEQKNISLTQALSKPQIMVLEHNGAVINKLNVKDEKILSDATIDEAAMPSEIYFSLIEPLAEKAKNFTVLPATPADIISAIANGSAQSQLIDLKKHTVEHQGLVTDNQSHSAEHLAINNDYYADKNGYVIQISAFSNLTLPKAFLASLTTIDFKVYQRLLNNKPLVVITSAIYADRSAAESALLNLPERLLQRQPWIKSVAVINNEINAFLHSQ